MPIKTRILKTIAQAQVAPATTEGCISGNTCPNELLDSLKEQGESCEILPVSGIEPMGFDIEHIMNLYHGLLNST